MCWPKLKSSAAKTQSSSERLVGQAKEVIRVRGICLIARAAAESAATDPDNNEAHRAYQNAKEQCLSVAEGMSDGFYKDTARHFIYVLCRRANDVLAAKQVLCQINTHEIRGKIRDGRPALFG